MGKEHIINVAICDDIKNHRNNLKEFIIEHGIQNNIEYMVQEYAQGEDLYNSDFSYDILFLDVYLTKENGIDIGLKLREKGIKALIVFVTSTKEYMLQGYEVSAFRYIVKPLVADIIYAVLDDCIKTMINSDSRISLYCEEGIYLLRTNEVIVVEALAYLRKRRVCGEKFNLVSRCSLVDIYNKLPINKFAYVNKSMIVNLDFVCSVEGNQLELKNGIKLPVSRKYKLDFFRKLHASL